MRTNKKNAGFTLVEILIVVVILGILAAIVIPQFTQASTEARENSLKANLQTIRSQIELYKIQHNDDLPGTVTGVDFEAAMTGTTDINGASSGTDFGPYLQQIPPNPFSVAAIAAEIDTGTTDPTTVSTTGGWFFNTSDGGFMAVDDTAHMSW
jgi:general secretion pathway protein G